MKKLIYVTIFSFLFSSLTWADSITLDSTETLSTPTTAKISDWEITRINANKKVLVVRYRWRDASNNVINLGSAGSGWETWTCRNVSQGDNDSCQDVDDPWDCCTGSETGTCPEIVDSCFTDVFSFSIRQQDVDTSIGLGLRTLIWNKMKQHVLKGVNDGTFD